MLDQTSPLCDVTRQRAAHDKIKDNRILGYARRDDLTAVFLGRMGPVIVIGARGTAAEFTRDELARAMAR